MGKGKLAKFADMAANPLVVECPYWMLQRDGFALKGKWNVEFFKNPNPIILELGCGRGEYTVGLARQFPDSIVASFLHFAPREYLREPEGKTDMPSMKI